MERLKDQGCKVDTLEVIHIYPLRGCSRFITPISWEIIFNIKA